MFLLQEIFFFPAFVAVCPEWQEYIVRWLNKKKSCFKILFYETVSTQGSLSYQLTHKAVIDFSECPAGRKHSQDGASYFLIYLHREWGSREESGGKEKERMTSLSSSFWFRFCQPLFHRRSMAQLSCGFCGFFFNLVNTAWNWTTKSIGICQLTFILFLQFYFFSSLLSTMDTIRSQFVCVRRFLTGSTGEVVRGGRGAVPYVTLKLFFHRS